MMSTPPSRNRILVVGSNAPNLVSEIMLKTDENLKQPNNSSDNENNLSIQPWTLRTKYYICDLAFWVLSTISASDTLDDWSVIAQAVDAVIIVFDKCDLDSFSEAKSVQQLLADHVSPAIAICVGCNLGGDVEISFDSASDWCLDHGWEYIDMDEVIAANIHDNMQDDVRIDTFGINRIIESLSAHVWEGMELLDIRHGHAASPGSMFQRLLADDVDLFGGLQDSSHCNEDSGDLDATIEKLRELRGLGMNMPDEERKVFALRVAKVFEEEFDLDLIAR